MSMPLSNGPFSESRHELEKLQHEWYWFLLLGILLIVGGTLAIGYSMFATLAAVTFFGLLLVVGGGARNRHARSGPATGADSCSRYWRASCTSSWVA